MMEERRLRVFENRVLRRIFGPLRYEVTGEWRNLHNEELYGLYFSQNTVKPGYTTNDVGLYDTSSVASDTLQYQLIPNYEPYHYTPRL